jgi:hypothetical protein
MDIKLLYSRASLHEAAMFIWENNPRVHNWPSEPKNVFDVTTHIRDFMIKCALNNAKTLLEEKKTSSMTEDGWTSFNGTGGYYLIFELIDHNKDEISIGVDILVNPGVNHPDSGYVTEVIEVVDTDTKVV